MKVFISYCQNNGGLDLAYKVCETIENTGRNQCQLYDRDKTPGADKYEEIKYRITGWCEVVIFLCTAGSVSSVGQRDEIVFIREWRIPVIPIRISESAAPSSLSRDFFNYQDIDINKFKEEFDARVARNLRGILNNQKTLEKNIIVKVQ